MVYEPPKHLKNIDPDGSAKKLYDTIISRACCHKRTTSVAILTRLFFGTKISLDFSPGPVKMISQLDLKDYLQPKKVAKLWLIHTTGLLCPPSQ